MVGAMVVNGPLQNCGGILQTWYLIGLVSLQSLIQILRAVTLVHKLRMGSSGMSRSLSGRSEGHDQVQRAQEGHPVGFQNFSVVDLPLVKSIDGLSAIGLQSFHCILTQQF